MGIHSCRDTGTLTGTRGLSQGFTAAETRAGARGLEWRAGCGGRVGGPSLSYPLWSLVAAAPLLNSFALGGDQRRGLAVRAPGLRSCLCSCVALARGSPWCLCCFCEVRRMVAAAHQSGEVTGLARGLILVHAVASPGLPSTPLAEDLLRGCPCPGGLRHADGLHFLGSLSLSWDHSSSSFHPH